MIQSIITSYKKFWGGLIDFSGRTNRFDFWVPVLINALIFGAVIGVIGRISSTLSAVVGVIYFIACLACIIRRVRDAGMNPLLVLLGLIPGIGQIILIVLCILPSK